MDGGGLEYVAVLIDVDEYGTVARVSCSATGCIEWTDMPCFGLDGGIFFVFPREGIDAAWTVVVEIGVFDAAGDEFIERPALVGLLGHI